jgi:hypothetical protein
MNRRRFLAALGTAPLLAQARARACLLVTPALALRMRGALTPEATALFNRFAAGAMRQGPWSVTYHRPGGLNVAAGPHDYVSEGPYWWPDPKNPTGPYIRKDGERNPARFMGNRSDLGNLCTAVLSLGIGASLLKRPECSARAQTVLSTWFLDPETRMNPNLEYGQMVRGHNTGRGTGIIDTVSFIHLVQGIMLLELAGDFDAAVSTGLRRWFAEYLKWMTTSSKGLDEKKSGNNHSTWWTAQVAAYATFAEDEAARRVAWDHYRTFLVPHEIEPDGSCPREEARTASLGYSSMNLDAFAVLCRIAEVSGVDLWRFHTPSGVGVDRAFRYLIPYVLQPDTWKKQQINRYQPGGYIFPGLAGSGLHSDELLIAWRKLPRAETPWVRFVDLAVAAELEKG